MKKTILISLVLVIASSSASAYQLVSQKKTNTFGGAPNKTYNITCNSGAAKTVISIPEWTTTTYKVENDKTGFVKGTFSSVDQAAKAACKE